MPLVVGRRDEERHLTELETVHESWWYPPEKLRVLHLRDMRIVQVDLTSQLDKL